MYVLYLDKAGTSANEDQFALSGVIIHSNNLNCF